jgi:hypothetical protein
MRSYRNGTIKYGINLFSFIADAPKMSLFESKGVASH